MLKENIQGTHSLAVDFKANQEARSLSSPSLNEHTLDEAQQPISEFLEGEKRAIKETFFPRLKPLLDELHSLEHQLQQTRHDKTKNNHCAARVDKIYTELVRETLKFLGNTDPQAKALGDKLQEIIRLLKETEALSTLIQQAQALTFAGKSKEIPAFKERLAQLEAALARFPPPLAKSLCIFFEPPQAHGLLPSLIRCGAVLKELLNHLKQTESQTFSYASQYASHVLELCRRLERQSRATETINNLKTAWKKRFGSIYNPQDSPEIWAAQRQAKRPVNGVESELMRDWAVLVLYQQAYELENDASILNKSQDASLEKLLAASEAHLGAGRLREALVCAKAALHKKPGCLPAYLKQAKIYERFGFKSLAYYSYLTAVAHHIDKPESYAELRRFAGEQKKNERLLQDLYNYAQNYTSPELETQIIMLQIEEGYLKEAKTRLAQLEEVPAYRGDFLYLHALIEWVDLLPFIRRQENITSQASKALIRVKERLNEALQIGIHDTQRTARAYFLLAEINAREGHLKRDEALQYLRHAIQANSRYEEAYKLFFKLHLLKFGRVGLEDYLESMNDLVAPQKFIALAETEEELGLPEEALKWLKEAHRLDPVAMEPLFRMAAIYEKQGNIPNAFDTYREIVKISRAHPEVEEKLIDLAVRHPELLLKTRKSAPQELLELNVSSMPGKEKDKDVIAEVLQSSRTAVSKVLNEEALPPRPCDLPKEIKDRLAAQCHVNRTWISAEDSILDAKSESLRHRAINWLLNYLEETLARLSKELKPVHELLYEESDLHQARRAAVADINQTRAMLDEKINKIKSAWLLPGLNNKEWRDISDKVFRLIQTEDSSSTLRLFEERITKANTGGQLIDANFGIKFGDLAALAEECQEVLANLRRWWLESFELCHGSSSRTNSNRLQALEKLHSTLATLQNMLEQHFFEAVKSFVHDWDLWLQSAAVVASNHVRRLPKISRPTGGI